LLKRSRSAASYRSQFFRWASPRRPGPTIELSVRRLSAEDRELCQSFDCGVEEYEVEVNNWIRSWVWEASAAWRGRTIIAVPTGVPEQLYGYGSWKYLDQVSEAGRPARHIAISWFGVHRAFRGERTAAGFGCAATLFRQVENDARTTDPGASNLPMTLSCHVDNDHGHDFWQRRGFRDLRLVNVAGQPPQRYQEMVR
jgi:GNAT superfamily N-acetyltransferase